MMLSLLGVVVSAANQPKPHIILVVADDQGHANIGYHNASTRTPRIDALAASGVKLENYYVQPICSPTRSALMTGRYTNRLGTQATVIRSDVPFGVPLENTFLSQNMQDAGCELQLCTLPRRSQTILHYLENGILAFIRGHTRRSLVVSTSTVSFLVVAPAVPFVARVVPHRAERRLVGYFEGAIDYRTHIGGGYARSRKGVDWHRGNQTVCFEDTGTWTEDLIVAATLDFLHRMAAKSKPFFLYYPLHLMHGPNQAPERFLNMWPERNLAATAASYGMCGVCECRGQNDVGSHFPAVDVTWGACRTVLAMAAALDWAVGELVDGLEDAGHYNNSIIIYTSDNGAQPHQGGTNFPLRGWKTELYEGGMKVPGWIHSPLLPAAVRGTVHRGLFHVVDWLPTIIHGIVGGNTSRNLPLDGVDIWSAIIGGPSTPSPRTEMLINLNAACDLGYVHPNAGMRVREMKLLVDCFNYTTMKPNGLVELYNITADPYEQNNLAGAKPEIVAKLMVKLAQHAASPDQVPPTLFPERSPKVGAPGIKPGFYQCPQCIQGNALCDGSSTAPEDCRLDPWCDGVSCSEMQDFISAPSASRATRFATAAQQPQKTAV